MDSDTPRPQWAPKHTSESPKEKTQVEDGPSDHMGIRERVYACMQVCFLHAHALGAGGGPVFIFLFF